MFRDNGVSVRLANDGMWAYLYDESNAKVVGDALDEIPEEGEETATVLELARRGVLVKCELRDEAPLDWEVAVGEPLSAVEKKVAKWMRLVRVPLDLPSGALVVATDATRTTDGEHAPATIPVSAGKYELALHMVDRDNMTETKYAGYDGPHAVVTLRPWPEKKKYRPRIGAIFYARDHQAANAPDGGPRAPWDGRYELDDGVFRGEVIATSDTLPTWSTQDERRMICNLDERVFTDLAMHRGQRLSVHVAGQTYTVLSLGRWHPMRAEQFLGKRALAALADLHPRLLIGYLSGTRIVGEPSFVARYHEYGISYRWHDYFVVRTITPASEGFQTDDPTFNTIFHVDQGTSVEVGVEPKPFFAIDTSLRDAWTVEDDVLHAKVVSATEAALFLNIDNRPLMKIGFTDGDTLELQIGDTIRTVYDKKYITGRDWIDIMERIKRPPPKAQAARAEELDAIIYDENGQMRPAEELPEGHDLLREMIRMEYHPDDLAAPPLALDFFENKDVDGWTMMTLKSAFWGSFHDPEEIHIDAAPGTPATVKRLGSGEM